MSSSISEIHRRNIDTRKRRKGLERCLRSRELPLCHEIKNANPSIHVGSLRYALIPAPKNLVPSSDFLCHCTHMKAYTHTDTQTSINNKNKSFLRIQKRISAVIIYNGNYSMHICGLCIMGIIIFILAPERNN